MQAGRFNRAILVIIIICIIVSLGYKLHLIANKSINEDEFIHLQWSWALTEGQLPYRDFMMVHTPLPQFLLAPLFLVFHDNTSIIFFTRVVFALFSLATLFLVYKIGRKLFSHEAALIATVFTLFVGQYAAKSVEVRPDQLAALFGAACIWYLVKEKPAVSNAGLFAGLAIVTNQKFIFMAAFLALGVLASYKGDLFAKLKNTAIFSLCLGLPVALFAVWLIATSSLDGFIRDNYHVYIYGGNLGSKAGDMLSRNRFQFFIDLFKYNPIYMVAALAGMALSFRKKRGAIFSSGEGFCWLYIGALAALFVMTLSHELQNTLYFIPVLSLFAGHAAVSIYRPKKSGETKAMSAISTIIILAIALPCMMGWKHFSGGDNAEQMRTWKKVLELTEPGDAVMDGHAGMFVYRKNALIYHPAAFEDARDIFYSFYDSEKDAGQQILKAVETQNVRLVIMEDVFESVLPPAVVDHIKTEYKLIEGYKQPLYYRM